MLSEDGTSGRTPVPKRARAPQTTPDQWYAELVQNDARLRPVLDAYNDQFKNRNGIYGAAASYDKTADKDAWAKQYATPAEAKAAAQQMLAGITPEQFSEGIVKGAPSYFSQFSGSAEDPDFFGMNMDTLVPVMLATIGGGAMSGAGYGAAASGAGAGGFSAAAQGGDVKDVLKGAAVGGLAGYAGGALGEAMGGTAGDAAWQQATDEALAGSGNYYVGNNAAGIDAFNAGAFTSAEDAAWQQAADEALAGSNNYYVGNNAAAIDAANGSAFTPSLNTDPIPSVQQETVPTVQPVQDTVPQLSGTETLADAGITPGSDFAQWLKDNPTTAIKLAGLFGGMLGGGGSSGGGGPAPGGIGSLSDQSGMTATPAVAQQRQYVAPPAGYRPGFDPEHKYFTGIGTVGTGG